MFTREDNYLRLAASNNTRFLIGDTGDEQHLSIYVQHGSFHIYMTRAEAAALAEMIATSVKEASHEQV